MKRIIIPILALGLVMACSGEGNKSAPKDVQTETLEKSTQKLDESTKSAGEKIDSAHSEIDELLKDI